MGNFKRMVLIENGQTCVIRNSDGANVTFDSLDELSRVTGIDFIDKFYVGYEPEKNYFVDSKDPTIDETNIPDSVYENLISLIFTLHERKDDITYGLSGVELEEAQAIKAQMEAESIRDADIEDAITSGGLKTYTLDEALTFIDNHVDNITDLASAKEEMRTIFKKMIPYILQ